MGQSDDDELLELVVVLGVTVVEADTELSLLDVLDVLDESLLVVELDFLPEPDRLSVL